MDLERLLRGVFIADIEASGLELDSRIHVLSVRYYNYDTDQWETMSTHNPEEMREVFENEDNIVVGHNFITYDMRVLKNFIPDMEVKAKIWDTLPLSYILRDKQLKHGLEFYGDEFGFAKEVVQEHEWDGIGEDGLTNMAKLKSKKSLKSHEKELLTTLERAHADHQALMVTRCERDVLINQLLWDEQMDTMIQLYDSGQSDEDLAEEIVGIIERVCFKEDMLIMQEENPILIDVELATKNFHILNDIYQEKVEALKVCMPKVPKYVIRKPPAKPYKASGELSATGLKWQELMTELGLPLDYNEPVKVVGSYSEPNPGSTDQIKEYLFERGWEPKEFKYNPKSGNNVPQINVDVDGVKALCPSIVRMISDYPELENLNSMSVIEHRLGILKNFAGLNEKQQHLDENNYVKAVWQGFASTLRVKHKSPIN